MVSIIKIYFYFTKLAKNWSKFLPGIRPNFYHRLITQKVYSTKKIFIKFVNPRPTFLPKRPYITHTPCLPRSTLSRITIIPTHSSVRNFSTSANSRRTNSAARGKFARPGSQQTFPSANHSQVGRRRKGAR